MHTLRHSSASLVARETGQALVVKALLQHDDLKTSMGYIHDVEDIIQDKYSPLRLLGEQYKKAGDDNGGIRVEQLELTEGENIGESVAVVPVSREVVAGADIDDLAGDMFPKIREGVAVRTLLKYEELLRRIFVWYARYNGNSNDGARARELMKRMLRKGGSERYSKRR